MEFDDENEVLAVVRASMGRRVLGIGCLGLLGVLLIYMGFVHPPALGYQIFLLALGAGALWIADAMRRGTSSRVELTPQELRDGDGVVIARVEDIVGIDRGFFAFKPSNGFLLKLRAGEGRIWRPGLWWRMGRRVGIGGMTPGSQTKFMSEILATMLATRKDPQG